jgi:N-dimethylarginine dimethylaminohydrolase
MLLEYKYKSNLRLSYLLWQEQQIPTLVIEIVSQTRRGEDIEKKEFYQQLGIKYYLIYNPLRKRKNRLEIYELKQGKYKLLTGNKIWLADLNLALGCEQGTYQGITRECLYWYNQEGVRYLTPEESLNITTETLNVTTEQLNIAKQEQIKAENRAKMLEEKLKKLGINPDEL